MMSNLTLIVVLFGAAFALAQDPLPGNCNCDSENCPKDALRLSADQTRKQVDHIEPLRPSQLDRNVALAGILVVEVRFRTDGKLQCARAISGNPIAIATAMEALPKWTVREWVAGDGAQRCRCGQLRIRYRLSNKEASIKLLR